MRVTAETLLNRLAVMQTGGRQSEYSSQAVHTGGLIRVFVAATSVTSTISETSLHNRTTSTLFTNS